jgi:hypothetical protein
MDEQGPNSGPDQPPTGCMPEASEPAWRAPWAPLDHPIYRGRQPHGPTPPIQLLRFRVTDTDQVPPPSNSTTDHRPCPLSANTERSSTSVTSVIIGPSAWVTRPDPCDVHRRYLTEQAYHRPSSPDALDEAPLPPGRTLCHESPDPPGDVISAPEAKVVHGRADAMGRTALWAKSAPRSPPLRQTSLLGRPPSDPWDGRHCKMHSPVGFFHVALSAPMDPLHQHNP